jgi:transcriptional regulator with XRE-family HTH domain
MGGIAVFGGDDFITLKYIVTKKGGLIMKPLHSPTATDFREKRLKAGLSQSDTAILLCVHVNTIKNYEAGRSRCSPATWACFCARLEERQEQLRMRVAELNQKLRSRAFRNEYLRKVRKKDAN